MPPLTVAQRSLLEKATLQYMENLHLAGDFLARRAISEEAAVTAALGVVEGDIPPAHFHLRGRLAIPYLTDAGPVNMNFRCMEDHDCREHGHNKYMKMKGMETNLYGVQHYHNEGDFVCLTEGELDAITLNMVGLPAIGVPGAENWKPHWNRIFEDFETVYIFSDGDEAGQKFAEKVGQEVPTSVNIRMPDGHDVNSAFRELGSEFLLERI